MTKRLYYEDTYQKEFTAKVVDVKKYKDRFGIILNQTCFYPEGGGQYGDTGWLDGQEVLDTQKTESGILHIVKNPIEIGKEIHGKLDWEGRFQRMQNHTSQHILSAAVLKLFNAPTVSVHFGNEFSTLDIRIDNLCWDDVHRLENFVNGKIYENLPINIYWAKDREELKKFPIRRPTKQDRNIRIVVIEGLDIAACGGTHLKNTGEIGIIKIRKWGKIRDCTRLEFLCGLTALRDYQLKNKTVVSLSEMFTVQSKALEDAIIKLDEENKANYAKIRQLKKQLLDLEVEELIANAEKIGDYRIIKKVFEDRESYDLKKIASKLTKIQNNIIFLGNLNKRSNLLFARSDNININMNQLIKQILPMINGKGGGRPDYAQGAGDRIGLEQAIESAYEIIKKSLINLFNQ